MRCHFPSQILLESYVHLVLEIWLNGEDVRGCVDVPEDDKQDEYVHDGPHHGQSGMRPRVVAEISTPLR